MYFNVVIKDKTVFEGESNQLVFHFGNDLDKAVKFANQILKISTYHVEILQFEDDE